MEFSHVFYTEFPFSANLTENNEIEQIKLKKSKIYTISRLSIDQDLKSNVSLPKIEGRKALSNILRVYAEEKNSFNLDLKIYKERYFDIIVPFKKEQMFKLIAFNTMIQPLKNKKLLNLTTAITILSILPSYHLGFTW